MMEKALIGSIRADVNTSNSLDIIRFYTPFYILSRGNKLKRGEGRKFASDENISAPHPPIHHKKIWYDFIQINFLWKATPNFIRI